MPQLTSKDRAEAAGIVASIRRRPAYQLASLWLERWVVHGAHRIADDMIDVDWVCNVMRHNYGGHVLEETMVVALHDHGWSVKGTPRGARCNMSELVLLDLIKERVAGGRRPRAFAEFSDPLP